MRIRTVLLSVLSLLIVSNLIGTSGCTVSSTATIEKPIVYLSQDTRDVNQRIERVENGLRLPVVIKGQTGVPMKLADRMKFYKTPGVSIAVINNGRIEWARGYGVREAGSREPITPETIFQAGSISKAVTATAVLRLVQAGKLNLDEDVNRKLVSWQVPENEFTKQEKVTIRRIVSHTAGTTNNSVGNYTFDAELPTLPQALDGAKPANSPAVVVDFVPGSRQRYSGGGFTVLQQLLIDVTKKPFSDFMREKILAPLEMKRSTFEQPLPKERQPSAAVGHSLDGEKIAGNWRVFPESAAAGLWSTPSDLARLAIEVQKSKNGKSDKILSASTTAQMLTPQVGGWGLGFVVEGENRTLRFSHGGSTDGYRSEMVAYTNTGQGAVIMANSDKGDRLAAELLRSIAREYGWNDFQPKGKIIAKIDPKVYADYVGKYQFEFSSDYVLTVGTESGNLTTELKQPTGQSKAELFPESETKFFRKDADVEVTFIKDETGQVTHLIFLQEGQEFRVRKIK